MPQAERPSTPAVFGLEADRLHARIALAAYLKDDLAGLVRGLVFLAERPEMTPLNERQIDGLFRAILSCHSRLDAWLKKAAEALS